MAIATSSDATSAISQQHAIAPPILQTLRFSINNTHLIATASLKSRFRSLLRCLLRSPFLAALTDSPRFIASPTKPQGNSYGRRGEPDKCAGARTYC
jgi:hypothetical protein